MEDDEDDDPTIHEGVKLLLARMESHPEEFENDARWARFYQQYKSHWNSTEKRLFSKKMRAIRMKAMHESLIKELMK